MTDDQKQKPEQDWNKLASEALDLWQNHLNNLANDPQMKEDLARMVAPMGQMFNQWMSVAQNTMQSMAGAMTPKDQEPQDVPQGDEPLNRAAEAREAFSADIAQSWAEGRDLQQGAAADDAKQSDVAVHVTVDAVKPDECAVCQSGQPDVTDGDTGIVYATSDDVTDGVNVAPEPVFTAPSPVQPASGGRAASADGRRDLAELAGRLAELERELDSLRPSAKRGAGQSASDADDAGDVRDVAGSR